MTGAAAPQTAPEAQAYRDALRDFRRARVRGPDEVVSAYHAVRNLPYFSGADRTPLAALRAGRGACTAKHMILRDLLRLGGATAAVELVEGDFASGLPVAEGMPDALKAMIREGGVRDVHCRVRLEGPEGPRRLDATWPDALAPLGFPVDAGWDGRGDSRQAIARVRLRSDAEDTLAEKARLLGERSPEETERRRRFLGLLSDWLDRLSDGGSGAAGVEEALKGAGGRSE